MSDDPTTPPASLTPTSSPSPTASPSQPSYPPPYPPQYPPQYQYPPPGASAEIKVDTEKLRKAAQDFDASIRTLVETAKNLVNDNTHLPATAWGLLGASAVSGKYSTARNYQVKQMHDFVRCLLETNIGLYSVALHYDQAELANAKNAYDVATDLNAKAAQMNMHRAEQMINTDNEGLKMARKNNEKFQ
jgi:hypothetical protein